MARRIHGLFVPLVFPTGIAPGEGGDDNLLTIAQDGLERTVLRGSSLAGALRHAWRKCQSSNLPTDEVNAAVNRYFGIALGDRSRGEEERGVDSPLQVGDVVLDLDQSSGIVSRTHHRRKRDTGVVADGGLFAVEACPPRTKGVAAFWLRDDEDAPDDAVKFLATLVALLESGVTLGGKSARGIGAAALDAPALHKQYDLRTPAGYANWLDEHRAWRSLPAKFAQGTPLQAGASMLANTLSVTFKLGIPRGQDLLVADGRGTRYDAEPQRVVAADGAQLWRLPGSSIRGLFRDWVTRLAARDNRNVSDADGPVAALFGSVLHAGRIHISDAYSACSTNEPDGDQPEEQRRKHVAVDRITGGAAESLLFENSVLTGSAPGQPVRFEVRMRVQDPTEDEARWLAKTLRALDLGVLRVGSSKSSGRLSLVETPRASGKFSDRFTSLQPHLHRSMFGQSAVGSC